MARKKRPIAKVFASTILEDESPAAITSSTVEKNPNYQPLRERLTEISQTEGITGYIIRNATSAAIDLKDPSNLVPFALMTSHTVDACQEFSGMFSLGKVENTLLEGQNGKVLLVTIGENIISVFMEKDIDHAAVLRQVMTDFEK